MAAFTATAGIFMMAGSNACASLIYTATGSDSDGTLDGQATFTFGNGYVTIVLANLLTGSHLSQGQAISGITFDIAGITASSTFGENFVGTTVDLPSGTTVPNNNLSNWSTVTGLGSVELAVTGVIGSGGKPEEMIIPGGTTYVGGISSHNPYVLNSASFTLSNSVFTTSSTVSDVSMLFGTGPDKILVGAPQPHGGSVPEPATLMAGALLLLPLGISTFRVLRKSRTA